MKVGFIGAGNMGGAIMKGAFQKGFLKPYETMVYDVSEQQLAALTAAYPVQVAESNTHLAKECEWIILAVKPIYMRGVLEEIQKYTRNKKIISIAAGWSMDMLFEVLGRENSAQVLRVMPNTPALVGAGCTALCEETSFTKASLAWARDLFATLGLVLIVPERLFDAVVAVSGSSPAYVFMFIEAMADGAVKQGMPRKQAIQAAAQAVMGSAKMVLETGEHPAVLKDNVCSPGGTTIEAVEALEKGNFRGTVMQAMEACVKKNQRMTMASDRRRKL